MQKHRMFKLARTPVEEMAGLEKWELVALPNPADPDSTQVSPIKIASATKTFGEFQLGNAILGLSQDHRFGQPPGPIQFSLPRNGLMGDAIVYFSQHGKLFFLVGELGSEDGKLYELPFPEGAAEALQAWVDEMSQCLFWEDEG